MKVTVDRLIPSCPDGKTCPTLAHTDDGAGIVVGEIVRDPEVLAALGIGPDEMAVKVPPSLAVWTGGDQHAQ